MPTKTAAEIEALAKLAYLAHREVLAPLPLPPWEELQALNRESWRAVVRALERAFRPGA